jgi:hypothetical protein
LKERDLGSIAKRYVINGGNYQLLQRCFFGDQDYLNAKGKFLNCQLFKSLCVIILSDFHRS